jgi:hypothetical protein
MVRFPPGAAAEAVVAGSGLPRGASVRSASIAGSARPCFSGPQVGATEGTGVSSLGDVSGHLGPRVSSSVAPGFPGG